MTIATKEKKTDEKLGTTDDPLNLELLIQQAQKVLEKFMKSDTQKEILYYPTQELRKGRPYYFLVWHEYVDGKRYRRKRYLGTSLPLGYSLGKPVNMLPPKRGVANEAK